MVSSDDDLWMQIAQIHKEKSHCQFYKVCTLAVNESGRLIATGVNGTPSGSPNCCDHQMTRDQHREFSDEYEIHSEMNLILELARSSVTFNRLTIYITTSPCPNCLKHLLGLIDRKSERPVTIDRIVYGVQYHRTSPEKMAELVERARLHGVELVQYQSSTLPGAEQNESTEATNQQLGRKT